jgi:hypothetical protein
MCSILIASLVLKLILFRENQRRENLTLKDHQEEIMRCGTEPCDSVSEKKEQISLLFINFYFFSILIFDIFRDTII